MNHQIWEYTETTKIKFGVELTQIKRVGSAELGGWIDKKKAVLGIRCWVSGGGVISGGEIWGGVISGGEIRGGVISGGEIRGGVIWGGVISGGVIWGGARIEKSDDVLNIGPIGSENGMFTAYRCEVGFQITRGCFKGSPSEFKAAVKKTHGRRKFGKIYMAILDLCVLQFGKDFLK